MSRIASPAVEFPYFSAHNAAPAAPAAAPRPRAPCSAVSHPVRSGGQNLQRFLVMRCFKSGPLSLDVTTAEGRDRYKLAVQAWAARPAGHGGASRERQAIAERIDRWLAANDAGAPLDLSNSALTSLPPLPSNLRSLNISNAFAADGPKKYPETWPPGLRELDISNNILRKPKLPDNLPDTLTILAASNCALTRLPKLPRSLEMLHVPGNQLEALPAMPRGLLGLDASANKIKEVPALPGTLKKLYLSGNPLMALPGLPDALERLDINGTRVSELPAALPVNLVYLNISHTSITGVSAGLSQALARRHAPLTLVAEGITLAAPGTAPANHPAVGTANVYGVRLASSSLSQAVAAWYGAPDARRDEAWERIDRDSQDGLANATMPLRTLLDSLKGTADYPSEAGDIAATRQARTATRTAFRQRVTDLLDAIGSDAELRKTCLAIAEDRVESCHDSVSLGFDEMEQALWAARAAKGGIPRDELVAMGKGRLKLLLLDELAIPKANAVALQVAAETWRRPDQVLETVEVVLAYRLALAERLGLPTRVEHMLYLRNARVTEQDLAEVEAKVKAAVADDGRVASFMAGWRPWQAELERLHPEEFSPQALSAAKDGLRSGMEAARADYDQACEAEGELSDKALNALAELNGFLPRFDTLEEVTFAEARERLTRTYMGMA